MPRNSVTYLIDEVRRLSNAGTNEFTAGTVTYFSDDHIERILDSYRIRLAREKLVFEPELDGGGTTVYKHARIGHGWLEGTAGNNLLVTDSEGATITAYTLSEEDGFFTFTNDQNGSSRYVTGWAHRPYKAAVDVLTSWISNLSHQVEFATDNMRVKRGQKVESLRENLNELKKIGGVGSRMRVSTMERNDINVMEADG